MTPTNPPRSRRPAQSAKKRRLTFPARPQLVRGVRGDRQRPPRVVRDGAGGAHQQPRPV